jgi:asparagine synthase (glutamine-hydrolysing)
MCGISGFHCWNEQQIDLGPTVEAMSDKLVHRGPESEGYFTRPGIALGHRRLKIIDLATGDQPIYNEDRSIALVFNGEIYNFRELRGDLETRGHKFSTSSDTESVVHAYEEYGLDCLSHLEGMFAFALWDDRRRRLFLVVDRLGIKPLVYFHTVDLLAFASELPALLACPQVPNQLNQQALSQYLELGYIPSPSTIYQGIYKLMPGHYLLVEAGKVDIRRYWNLLDSLRPVNDFNEAKDHLRGLVTTAVQKRLIADVPLGAFLSGGIDSSIVVGLMARQSSKPVKTFSIGFADQPLLDETDYATTVAEFNETDHHAFRLSHVDILDAVSGALNGLGQPFADYSFLPTYLVSRETRREVTVALSGDGADELFAGYTRYRGEVFHQYYFALPPLVRRRILRPLIEALPIGRKNHLAEFARKSRRFLDGVAEDAVARQLGWMRIVKPEVRESMLRVNVTSNHLEQSISALYQSGTTCWKDDEINRVLYVDLLFQLPFQILVKVDLASMQHALEVRVPFLDHHVTEFAFSLPGHFKFKGLKSKYILKETFADLLPPKLRNRRKQGFDLPVGDWLKREMRDPFHDVVLADGEGDPLLNRAAVRGIYESHCQGKADYTKLLWALFVFQWWRRAHRFTI